MTKALPLACAAVILAGCSQTPSDSEIKQYIEPLFASCKNIQVGGVSKTNGAGQSDAYEVEFAYKLDVDEKALERMRKIYLEEKERSTQFTSDLKAYEQRKRELEEAISQHEVVFQRANPMPVSATLSGNFSREYIEARQAEHDAIYNEWKRKRAEGIMEETSELEALNRAWSARAAGATATRFRNTNSISSELNAFYEAGCSYKVTRFMMGMFREPVQDQSELFDRKHFQMNGRLLMRKTEQGWRVIEGS